MNWLLANRAAPMKVNDPNHRVSNDTDLALGDEGLKSLVSLVSLVMGTDQGPWGEGRWHQMMKEVSLEYITVADAESDFVDRAGTFARKWHLKLILLNYHLVSTGVFDKSANIELLQTTLGGSASATAAADRTEESGSTSRDSAWERDMKRRCQRRCQNQLQLQSVVMSDYDVYQLVRVVVVVALRPSRLFHGLQNSGHRSVPEVRQWYCSQACGGWLEHLLKTGACFPTARLQEVGLCVPDMQRFDGGVVDNAQGEHPWRAHQDWLAGHLGGLVIAVLHRRLLSTFWHTNQFPGMLAGLLDESCRHDLSEWIRAADGAWRVAVEQQGQWWAMARKRSSWNHLVVIKALRGAPVVCHVCPSCFAPGRGAMHRCHSHSCVFAHRFRPHRLHVATQQVLASRRVLRRASSNKLAVHHVVFC